MEQVLAIGSSSATFAAVKFGLGKSEDIVAENDDLSVSKVRRVRPTMVPILTLRQAIYAADILYILTLWLSKGATILLTERLTRVRQHRLVCYALGGFVSLWAMVSVFVIAIRDNKSEPWLDRSTKECPSLVCSSLYHESQVLMSNSWPAGLASKWSAS